jgi:prepilin-type N-terminal cleavage/methylation domain-containing protein
MTIPKPSLPRGAQATPPRAASEETHDGDAHPPLPLRGFSLLELLVVMAVIALLIGITLPAMGSARASARTIQCLSQMRQINLAALAYAQDNQDRLPRSSHSANVYGELRWGPALMPYLNCGAYQGNTDPSWTQLFNGLYRCPCDKRRNAAWS